MEAGEAKIQRVLEGSKQFLIPHFQRPYSWREDQWKVLWRDLVELVEDADSKPHFLGPIVSAPARTVPEGVEKRLLIDGQQRLTTVLVLLAAIRDRAREGGSVKLSERIQDLITNRHEEGNDHYKLLPTQGEDPADSDRETFVRLVEGGERAPSKSWIGAAHNFFAAKLRREDAPDLESLQRAITTRLTLVSIILDEKDNPHRIFESLNGKGRPLSQADLIRNYFFMRLHEREHERVYIDVWRPMQKRLGEEALTDFVRHYLARSGSIVRESDVYAGLKASVEASSAQSPLDHLRRLARNSEIYEVLLHPEMAPSAPIRERLFRLNRLEVTVAYPFLLAVYEDFVDGRRAEAELLTVLDIIESYIVRRFVCGVPTQGLNKIFAPLYVQAQTEPNFLEAVKRTLAAKSCPQDEMFRERLRDARLYGGGERREKTRLILERLEAARGHKERVDTANLSIEHVMPQSLTEEWQSELGESWEEDHDELLHTLGNLTLTSYNSELSNSSFSAKKEKFAQSHLELNRYFEKVERWTSAEIERRSEALSEFALSLWPYFGPHVESTDERSGDETSVTGTVPSAVTFRGRTIVVLSWAEVAIATMECIVSMGEEEFTRVVSELPRLVGFDITRFRRSARLKHLSNGAFVDVNLAASAIHRLCVQAAQLAGLGPEEWAVTYERIGAHIDDDEESTAEAPSQLKQLQLDFWTEVTAALGASGKFSKLRPPRGQHWFNIALGRSQLHMALTAHFADNRVCAKIVLTGESSERVLEALLKDRAAIESVIGSPLDWNANPENRRKTIKLVHTVRLTDRASWPHAVEWLTKTAVLFREAFAQRASVLEL